MVKNIFKKLELTCCDPVTYPDQWYIVDKMPYYAKREMRMGSDLANDPRDKVGKWKAFQILNWTDIIWEDEDEEILMNDEKEFPFKLTDQQYDSYFIQGHDGSGSPGTEEQQIKNMLIIVHPWIPTRFYNQLVKLAELGHHISGWNMERKIGLVINPKKSTIRYTKGGKKRITRKRSHILEDGTAITY